MKRKTIRALNRTESNAGSTKKKFKFTNFNEKKPIYSAKIADIYLNTRQVYKKIYCQRMNSQNITKKNTRSPCYQRKKKTKKNNIRLFKTK